MNRTLQCSPIMEQEIKELKSVLRSLVVSCPTQVDVRSLLRDYRNMVGAPIPLAKYGYKDPIVFLKERCSDCFVFQGSPANPVLTLIVPESLKHIDKFVQSQKLSSAVKFKGKRRSIPGQLISQPNENLIVSTFKSKQPAVGNKTNQTRQHNTSQDLIGNNSGLECRSPQKSDQSLRPITKKTSNISISDKVNGQENDVKKSSPVNEAPCSSEALQNFLKKRLPVYNSSYCVANDNEEASNSARTSSRDDADSGRQTLSSSSSAKAAKLEALKSEISGLIVDHPEGILCTDLMRLYRERFGRELDFSRFGYTSILSLVMSMEAVVRCTPNAAGNWLLTDPKAEPPQLPRRPPLTRPRHAPVQPVDPDDALPGIDFDPDVFPADCMHFAESIPPARLEGVAAGDLLEVMVGEVYSPSHFWLLRLGPDHYEQMCDIMDEMTKYYSWGEGRDRSLALGAVRVGHYCSSVFERDWHRSLIVRILDSDTVKVRHVDYGTVETVKVSTLKPLLRKWASLPAQAIRARLAGVCPAARGRRWTHAASAHFLRLVSDARLVANVVGVHAEEDILEVFLVNTLTEDDILIDKELVRSGHADACTHSQAEDEAFHLLPRFGALEDGLTPNFSEIHGYLRDGIALEFVDDYRRHVPSCLPPLPPAPASSSDSPPPSSDSPPATPEPPRVPSPAPSTSSMSSDSIRASPVSPRVAARASAPEFAGGAKVETLEPLAAASAPAEVFNRVPLLQPPMPSPPPPRPPPAFRHPKPPAPHPFHPMMPMHSYGSYPPFPGAVPFYPPCPSPMPVFVPGPPCPPGPLCPPGPPCPPGPHMFQHHHHPPPPVSRTSSCFLRSDATPPPPPVPRTSQGEIPHPVNPSAPASPAGGVTLTAAECEVFELLSKTNPELAQRFMADAISRAMRGTSPGGGSAGGAGASTGSPAATPQSGGSAPGARSSSLNPLAAEFRLVVAGTQTEPSLLPFPLEPLPPGMRPPPGLPPPPGFGGSRPHLA